MSARKLLTVVTPRYNEEANMPEMTACDPRAL
jgi:hypothetical protein